MSNHHLVRAEDALVWGRQWTVRGQINNNMYSTQSTWGCSDNSDEGLLLTPQVRSRLKLIQETGLFRKAIFNEGMHTDLMASLWTWCMMSRKQLMQQKSRKPRGNSMQADQRLFSTPVKSDFETTTYSNNVVFSGSKTSRHGRNPVWSQKQTSGKQHAKMAQPSAENFPSKPFPPAGVDHSRLMARLPWHLLRQTFLHRINPFLFEHPPSFLNTFPFASDLLLHIILFHSELSQWHRHAVIQGCPHHRQHDSPCSLLC